MDTRTEAAVISEERWRAWEIKGELRQAAFARKVKIALGILIGIVAVSGALYRFVG